MAEEAKKKPQGPLGRLKELATDKEEQLELLSVLVRIVVLFWSGAILSLNYVTIPNYEKDKIDPTFIASVFTGVLATFGIETAKKRGDGTMKVGGGSGPGGAVSKQDMEKLQKHFGASRFEVIDGYTKAEGDFGGCVKNLLRTF